MSIDFINHIKIMFLQYESPPVLSLNVCAVNTSVICQSRDYTIHRHSTLNVASCAALLTVMRSKSMRHIQGRPCSSPFIEVATDHKGRDALI